MIEYTCEEIINAWVRYIFANCMFIAMISGTYLLSWNESIVPTIIISPICIGAMVWMLSKQIHAVRTNDWDGIIVKD